MVEPERALAGRDREMPVPARHAVLGTPLKPPFPDGFEQAIVGMGCFWGAERVFWQAPGVYTTAVGYVGRLSRRTPPTRRCAPAAPGTPRSCSSCSTRPRPATRRSCACSGRTTTRPRACARATTSAPSTARRSTGRPRSSARSPSDAARPSSERLRAAGYGEITTEIAQAGPFYYAEDYHQQYLAKNPGGYCGLGGTGVSCPVGIRVATPTPGD